MSFCHTSIDKHLQEENNMIRVCLAVMKTAKEIAVHGTILLWRLVRKQSDTIPLPRGGGIVGSYAHYL